MPLAAGGTTLIRNYIWSECQQETFQGSLCCGNRMLFNYHETLDEKINIHNCLKNILVFIAWDQIPYLLVFYELQDSTLRRKTMCSMYSTIAFQQNIVNTVCFINKKKAYITRRRWVMYLLRSCYVIVTDDDLLKLTNSNHIQFFNKCVIIKRQQHCSGLWLWRL